MTTQQNVYTKNQLFALKPPSTLTGRKLEHVAFPLGGIGAGSVSLGGWGQLRDWEIQNRPAKGATLNCQRRFESDLIPPI